ncbi:hypothetical protein ACFQ4A_09310 [Lentibacillus salinarum]|uniref:Bacterial transcriptional activator domain-containing protein n=2 Tax=Lentibacillus salinarum TaxID=446820 RepID=A0ABW3ZUZ9_9BACI
MNWLRKKDKAGAGSKLSVPLISNFFNSIELESGSERNALVKNAEARPKEAARLWRQLYDDSKPVKERIDDFYEAAKICDKNSSKQIFKLEGLCLLGASGEKRQKC